MKKLAERLQIIFEQAYEENQPYATKEENVEAVRVMLSDNKSISLLLQSLDEIKKEYNINMDDEIDELYQILQEKVKSNQENVDKESPEIKTYTDIEGGMSMS